MAHWRFDEGEGTVLYDDSDNNNDGTLELGSSGQTSAGLVKSAGNTAWYNGRMGKQSYSLNFDGIDDYVDLGSDSSLDITGKYISVAAWVKRNSLSGGYIVSRGRNASSCYAYTLYQNGDKFQWYPRSGTEAASLSHDDYAWHYVVGVYDATLPSENMKIYVDGVLEGTNDQTSSLVSVACNTIIGADPCLLYTSPSPRDLSTSRMPSSA